MSYSIAIIGSNHLGNSIYNIFNKYYSTTVYKSINSPEFAGKTANIIFICLSNAFLLDDALDTLSKRDLTDSIVVISSLTSPGTVKYLSSKYSFGICCVVMNDNKVIIGTATGDHHKAVDLYRFIYGMNNIDIIDSTSAEMVNYTKAKFASVKSNFLEEIKDMCDDMKINYVDMIGLISSLK